MDWRNRPKHNVGRGGVRPRLSYPSLGSTCLGLDPPLTSCPPRWLLPGLCQGLPSVVACLLPLPVACGDQAFFNLPFISRPRPSEIGFDVGPAPRGGNQGFLRPGLDSDHCPQPRRGPEVSWPSGQDPESDPPHTHTRSLIFKHMEELLPGPQSGGQGSEARVSLQHCAIYFYTCLPDCSPIDSPMITAIAKNYQHYCLPMKFQAAG